MSVTAPQGLPPLQGTPRAPSTAPATGKFPDLHSLAVDVHQDIAALSAGLARAGASPDVIHTLATISGQIGDVARVLGQAPPIANPAHQAEAPPMRQAAAPAPQQQAPMANAARLGEAVAALHAGMIGQAQQKQQNQAQPGQ